MANPQITPLVPRAALALPQSACLADHGVVRAAGPADAERNRGARAGSGGTGRNGGANVAGRLARLRLFGRLLLYPAVFLLTAGIFTGAVWANASWGRYWGWDPKEVWALITLIVYALPLHEQSLARFRRPLFFHAYTLWASLRY